MASIDKRTLGVNYNKEGMTEICVWSPLAEKMTMLVNEANKIDLSKDQYGYWKTITDEIHPGDSYHFILDDTKTLPDPASLSQPNGVHASSQFIDLTHFNWEDNSWKNISLKDYIIYELHTGTFTPEGTFHGIEKKLDYLLSLGITAIEIMPVAQFPGNRNWGYDGVFPFAVQNTYGGVRGLQHLVNACHQKGIAVILDVVYNHLGPEGNYLNEFAPYFTDKYKTPWGKAINFDDEFCDGVREFFIENALMWSRDFHIDALRLDAVHAIKDFSPKHILQEIKEHTNALMAATGRVHYLIVECDLNDTRFINPIEQGYGMDAQWADEFHHALRRTTGEAKTGYYADFEGIHHLAKAYKDAYVYDGQYAPHRHKKFGVKTNNPGQQFVVFSQNHDQIGNRLLGERTSQLVSFEMQKLMAGAVMLSPFLPLLFMGEEYGEQHPFLYFISHSQPELIEAVRKGRKEEFAAFHAAGEAPDPQSEKTFLESKLQWDLKEEIPHLTLLNFYKELIALRKIHPALSHLNREQLDVKASEKTQILQLHRWHEDEHILCLMNFSKQMHTISFPSLALQWQKILDSADPKWDGKQAAKNTATDNVEINLQPESILIYSTNYV